MADRKLPIDCPHCGQRFSVSVPRSERLNTGRVSMVVVSHEKPVKCICGGACVLAIEAAQLAWVAMPITDRQAAELDGSRIITVPEGVGLIG